MPLPEVAFSYRARFTVTGSPLQRPASFHLDFIDNLETQDEAALWTDLDANVTAAMWNTMSSNCGITKVEIYKLDGISAGYIQNIAAFPAKWTGSGGADAVLQGSMVVSIKSVQRGPKWRNRAYVGPVAEAKQVDGVLDAATLATSQAAWTAFRTAMRAQNWFPEVISPSTGASGTGIESSQYLLRPYLKTQRRRARR